MNEKFKVEFLPEAVEFMESLDQKSQQKIYYNIKKAQLTNDSELFKKLVSYPEVRPFKNRKLITSFTNFKWNKNEKDPIYRKSNHCYIEAT